MFKKYADYYDKVYRYKNYKGEAQFVYRWADKPKLIIDLGCGTGRHHKYWPCSVVGLDQSKEMLKYAQKSKNRLYWPMDIENLPLNISNFPCYTALFNVVGYCNLENIISHLKQPKGGLFIFDCWDMNKSKAIFEGRIKKFSWGKVIIEPLRNEFNECVLKIKVEPTGKKSFFELHSALPYSLKHIENLCRKYDYKGERKDTNGWSVWYRLEKL